MCGALPRGVQRSLLTLPPKFHHLLVPERNDNNGGAPRSVWRATEENADIPRYFLNPYLWVREKQHWIPYQQREDLHEPEQHLSDNPLGADRGARHQAFELKQHGNGQKDTRQVYH